MNALQRPSLTGDAENAQPGFGSREEELGAGVQAGSGEVAADMVSEPKPVRGPTVPSGLPLDLILLKCACGLPDCPARASFSLEEGNLLLQLENAYDHFVLNADLLWSIIGGAMNGHPPAEVGSEQ